MTFDDDDDDGDDDDSNVMMTMTFLPSLSLVYDMTLCWTPVLVEHDGIAKFAVNYCSCAHTATVLALARRLLLLRR